MAFETETTLILKLPGLNEAQVKKIAKLVISTIEKRTAKGLDKDGRPFTPYSSEYVQSKVFEAAGGSSTVDLRLSGEMMTDLDVLTASNGRVSIGFPSAEQRAKAHGHITAKNGTGDLPKRDFLGVTMDELASAIRRSGVVSSEAQVEALLKKAEVV